MSFELLLILAVFVLLPLLQQLLRVMRQPDQRSPDRAEVPASEHQPAMEGIEPPAHAPLPRAPAGPRRPATARHKLSEPVTDLERAPARDASGLLAPAPEAGRVTRRRTPIADLRNPRGLRRAIVLTTILGPCRANRQ